MRNILDLVLTLFVLLLVWVVPRLALESRRRKQRAAQKAPGRAVPGAEIAEAVPAPEEESYDWDEKVAESWLERQRGADASPGAQPVPLPAVPVTREEEGEEPDYYSHEEAPAGRLPALRTRRSALRRAVIWKEILDSPKALHPNPFR